MKPCRSEKKIQKLIDQHIDCAEAHKNEVVFHLNRVEVLTEYLNELRRPGFKIHNEWITIRQLQTKYKNIVVSAQNTWQAE